LGETVTALGVVPAVKGDPATGVNSPVVLLTVNADTLFAPPSLVTYTNELLADTVIADGAVTPEKGEPIMVVSAPLVAIMYPNTLLDPLFATYAIRELIPPPFPNPPSPPPLSVHPPRNSSTGKVSHDDIRVFMWCPLVCP
jgi:hypothetical protein